MNSDILYFLTKADMYSWQVWELRHILLVPEPEALGSETGNCSPSIERIEGGARTVDEAEIVLNLKLAAKSSEKSTTHLLAKTGFIILDRFGPCSEVYVMFTASLDLNTRTKITHIADKF